MTTANERYLCLNCGRPEAVVPLVSLRYNGNQEWICSQCLPVLIHRPEQLAGKMANAENLIPAEPDDH